MADNRHWMITLEPVLPETPTAWRDLRREREQEKHQAVRVS
jgi:hypothetical protein